MYIYICIFLFINIYIYILCCTERNSYLKCFVSHDPHIPTHDSHDPPPLGSIFKYIRGARNHCKNKHIKHRSLQDIANMVEM